MEINMRIFLILLMVINYHFVNGNGENSSKEEEGPVYRVATVLNYPWMMESHSGYKGILVDLLAEVAALTKFTYIINDPPNTVYGRIQYTVGGIHVNGVIGDLISNRADLAVADIIISDMRSNVVSFSSPFATTGAQILIRPPDQNSKRNIGLLLVPFSAELWICIIVTSLLTAVVTYVMDRLCQKYEHRLNAVQSFHQTLSMFILQDRQDLRPPSTAHRILSICCRTFSIIILVTYTASLAGYLQSSSVPKPPVIPFKTFEQMSRQADVQYGGWFEMTLNLNDNVQRLMDRHITSKYSYYSDIAEAVERVMHIENPFAAVVEGYEGQKAVSQHCELMLLEERLFEIDYALACRKDFRGQQLCSNISVAIQILKESGKLYEIIERWWQSSSSTNGCDKLSEDNFVTAAPGEIIKRNFEPIDVPDMLLAFLVLLFGCISSSLATAVEQMCRKKGSTHKDSQCGSNLGDGSTRTSKPESCAPVTLRLDDRINGSPATAQEDAEFYDIGE